jgi:hypothetical protein
MQNVDGETSWKTSTWKTEGWEDNIKMDLRQISLRIGGTWNWLGTVLWRPLVLAIETSCSAIIVLITFFVSS